MAPTDRLPDVVLERVEAVCCRPPELVDEVDVSDDEEELEDVVDDDEEDSGAVLDEVLAVVVLELVEVEVSLGAVLVVLELVVLVVDEELDEGAEAITIGELEAAAPRSVEKPTVAGAVVEVPEPEELLVLPLLPLCAAWPTTFWAVVIALVTPGSIGGNTTPGTVTESGSELRVAVTAEDVTVIVVGTVVPVRSQLVALPARLS